MDTFTFSVHCIEVTLLLVNMVVLIWIVGQQIRESTRSEVFRSGEIARDDANEKHRMEDRESHLVLEKRVVRLQERLNELSARVVLVSDKEN